MKTKTPKPKKAYLGVYITPEVVEKLRKRADAEGRKISFMVEQALVQHLQK